MKKPKRKRLPRPLPKAKQWSRTERQAMAAMAEQHVKDKREEASK